MPLLDNELAHRDGNGLELRPQPLRVRWVLDGLATADDHDLRCAFTASVRALSDPIERRTLGEVLLGSRSRLTADDVSEHFAPTLRSAAAAAAKVRGVEAWLAPEARGALIESLKEAAAKVAFATGLEVLAPFELEVESRTYEQERLRQMQRALAERQAAGQAEHLARAGELLKKFQQIRQSAPELSAGQVLEQINPADRGSMLQTLLLASAKQEQAADLWAVAGEYLVKIDARDGGTTRRAALNPLPPVLGPLRSVQPATVRGERVLLVGARSGIMVVRPDGRQEPEIYPDAAVESQYGFSRVVLQEGDTPSFVACHGEAGLVRWALGRTNGPVATYRPDRFTIGDRSYPLSPDSSSAHGTFGDGGSVNGSGSFGGTPAASHAPGPRNLQVLDGERLLFSVANRLWLMTGEDFAELPAESDADILAIVPTADRRVLVVHEDGTVCTFDRDARQITARERRGVRLRAAGGLPWLGGTRLLLATDQGPIECVGADDPLITQYCSPYRGFRVVTGSADLVAGVSPDRQRLVLWPSWDGRQPAAEVYLTALTRHRIADVEFG